MNGTRAALSVPAMRTAARVTTVDAPPTWWRLTLLSAASVTLLNAALLQRKHGLFTGGFLASHQLGTLADSAAFLMVVALLNATVTAPFVYTALRAGRWLRLRPNALRLAALCVAVLPLVVADFITYQIWAYLGDAFDFQVMVALTGHRMAEIFAVTRLLMARPLVVFGIGLAGIAALTGVLHWIDRRACDTIVLPAPASAARRCLALATLSAMAVVTLSVTSESMGFGLRWTPAGQLFTLVLNRLSDVDRDGYGLLRNPRDTAAFNPAIHPYAIDIPGNGVDENGLAGDLPIDRIPRPPAPVPQGRWPNRPPVILFVLEGVRADAVGTTHNGRRVTPVMDRLAADGLKVESAWSHAGSTAQSRYHILTGGIIERHGQTTILDDFKDQGYEVAYFSGQDDGFGSMGVDYGRVDKFYDARQDVRNRYSRSTTPGSLAVPHRIVEQRIGEYLAERRRTDPLFVYVNFHDTHYPYDHAGLENLLDVQRLQASLISPGYRHELLETYVNAIANVDGAIGRVIAAVEADGGQRPAVIVISDHGESLFEQGILGHGFALNDAQTRVPLIVRDLPVQITLPFGQSDLRRTITGALAAPAEDGRPVAIRSRSARVFQYLGTVDTPSQIGWKTGDGWFTYDFRSDRVGVWESSVRRRDLRGEPKRLFEELIHTWEGMLLRGSYGTVEGAARR